MSFWSLFLASLIGSPHCAGMCGGFSSYIATANWGSKESKSRNFNFVPQIFYHCSRLATYMCLGALAGSFGKAVDHAGIYVGIRQLAPLLVGLVLITHAVFLFLGKENAMARFFAPVTGRFTRALSALSRSGRVLAPSLLGVLTAFLPCGWLYSFVVLAVATQDPLQGALYLFVFGLGTLPVLLGLGNLVRGALIRTRTAPARIVSVLVFVAGFVSLGQHLGWLPHWMPQSHSTHSNNCPMHDSK